MAGVAVIIEHHEEANCHAPQGEGKAIISSAETFSMRGLHSNMILTFSIAFTFLPAAGANDATVG